MNNELLTYRPLPDEQCLTEEQLYGYIDGKLSPAAQHAVEKHLLDCDMCSDALEGLQLVKNREKAAFVPPVNASGDNKEEESGKDGKGKVVPLFTRRHYAAAAAVVIILTVSLFIMQMGGGDSLKMAYQEEAPNRMADSIAHHEPADENTVSGKDPVTGNAPAPPAEQKIVAESQSAEGDFVVAEDAKQEDAEVNVVPKDADGQSYYPGVAQDKAAKPAAPASESLADDGNIEQGSREGKKDVAEKNKEERLDNNTTAKNFKIITDRRTVKRKSPLAAKQPRTAAYDQTSNAPAYKKSEELRANGTSPDLSKSNAIVLDSVSANGGASYSYTPAGTGAANQGFISTSGTATVNSNTQFSTNLSTVTVAEDSRTSPAEDEKPSAEEQYDQGMKLVQSNLLNAAIASFDEVLRHPLSTRYEDAQWQKSLALIKLNKKAEAKILLETIVKRGGKYKTLAETQLKQL